MKLARKEYTKKLTETFRRLRKSKPQEFWKLLNPKQKRVCDVSLESFYKYFENMQNINLEDGITDNDTCINEHIIISNDVLDMYFTGADVKKGIKNLKCNKSSGIDKLTEEILLPVWTLLFNHILDTGSIPSNWQAGKIVPIYKKGDANEPNNYRAITITSCLGKLFTLLNTRLSSFVNINENQAGFHKNHSNIDHIFVIKALLDIYSAKKKKLFCCFVDYTSAFDTIWHAGMYIKLIKEGVTGKILNVAYQLYQNVKSCVELNGNKFDYFCCNIGVCQGDSLSPLLFAIFVNDLESYLLQEGNNYMSFGGDARMENMLKLLILMYADDRVILADSPDKLQAAINGMEKYCEKWKLKVNVSKTKIIIFDSKNI